jgi:hypothetical protein
MQVDMGASPGSAPVAVTPLPATPAQLVKQFSGDMMVVAQGPPLDTIMPSA